MWLISTKLQRRCCLVIQLVVCLIQHPYLTSCTYNVRTFQHVLQAHIQLTTNNIPTSSSYECVFDFGMEDAAFINTATSQGGGVYTCPVPGVSKIPELSEGRGEYA